MTVLPVTSALVDAPLLRVAVQPIPQNGLGKTSQIMGPATDSVAGKLGGVIGHLDDATMLAVNRALAVFVSLA